MLPSCPLMAHTASMDLVPQIEIEITDNSLVSILDVVLRGRLVGVLLPPSEAQVLRS